MDYRHICVATSIGPVGAVISDVDLSDPLSVDVTSELHRAWLDHKILFFHDQEALTPATQAAFGERFGKLDVYPFMHAVDGHPNVIPIITEPDATVNFGGGWHTDTSYVEKPPKATILHAVEVPTSGGETLFADAGRAYEDLSEGMRTWLEGLTGIYSPRAVHGRDGAYTKLKAASGDLGGSYGGSENFAESEVEHPIIRTHEETGHKSINGGRAHVWSLKGWERDETKPILNFLNDDLSQDQFVFFFNWRYGYVAMLDYRCVFHYALNNYPGERRHMHRVIVQGARPG